MLWREIPKFPYPSPCCNPIHIGARAGARTAYVIHGGSNICIHIHNSISFQTYRTIKWILKCHLLIILCQRFGTLSVDEKGRAQLRGGGVFRGAKFLYSGENRAFNPRHELRRRLWWTLISHNNLLHNIVLALWHRHNGFLVHGKKGSSLRGDNKGFRQSGVGISFW